MAELIFKRRQFDAATAQKLPYMNEQFEQYRYLQQLISLIEAKENSLAALRELARILKKNGVAYLLFLFRASREKTPVGFLLKWYLKIVRTFVHQMEEGYWVSPNNLRDKTFTEFLYIKYGKNN
ncbi:MAG: hypothetical protein AB7S78_03465 [Candidatus Omnitrophota bacterium]